MQTIMPMLKMYIPRTIITTEDQTTATAIITILTITRTICMHRTDRIKEQS